MHCVKINFRFVLWTCDWKSIMVCFRFPAEALGFLSSDHIQSDFGTQPSFYRNSIEGSFHMSKDDRRVKLATCLHLLPWLRGSEFHLCMIFTFRVVTGEKNSPTVAHACRKRRLKWVLPQVGGWSTGLATLSL